MKKRLEPVIFYILLVATIIIVAYLAYNHIIRKVTDERYEYVYTDETFTINDLAKGGFVYKQDSSAAPKKYTAIFLANSTGCSACMGQYQIYNRVLTDKKYYNTFNRVLAVLDTNIIHARWFAKVNQLKINSIADISAEQKNVLMRFNKDTYEKQILIVDNGRSKIIFRIKIKTEYLITYEDLMNKMPEILKPIGIIINNKG